MKAKRVFLLDDNNKRATKKTATFARVLYDNGMDALEAVISSSRSKKGSEQNTKTNKRTSRKSTSTSKGGA